MGREFKNLNIVTQKSYDGRDTGLHRARLDVYIEEGDEVEIDSSNVSTIYDIEPDKNNKRKDIDFIAQRTRFYHAIIDSRSLKSGQSYDKLKKVFVIFICPYDPFGDDRMIYTIRNHCVENPELPYEDGARTIFLYTKGRKGRDNESLSQLLDYMENTTRENAVSEELEAIQEMVQQVGAVRWEGEKVTRGVIIRHLILPGNVENSLRVLDWIGENFAPGEVLVSLMRQYTPMGGLPAPFDRRVTDEEYDAVLSWMYLNELEGFTQEAEAADTGFIPDFLAD